MQMLKIYHNPNRPQCKWGNCRYQTSPTVCNHTFNSIYFLNL